VRERGSLPNLPQLSKLAWRKGNRQKDEELSPSSVHKEDRNSSSAIHEVATCYKQQQQQQQQHSLFSQAKQIMDG